jgi:hypothetical protein
MEVGSMEEKERMVEGYLGIYDEIERDSANAMTDVQSVAAGNFDVDSIRVWQYWITLDTLLMVRRPDGVRLTKAIHERNAFRRCTKTVH